MGKGTQRGQGTVKRQNRKQPHMTFRLTGGKEEKRKTINSYLGSNRKGKRNLIRKQKRDNINHRLETTEGAFGQSKLQKEYNKRNEKIVQVSIATGETIKECILNRNANELHLRLKDIQYKTSLPKEFESVNKD